MIVYCLKKKLLDKYLAGIYGSDRKYISLEIIMKVTFHYSVFAVLFWLEVSLCDL